MVGNGSLRMNETEKRVLRETIKSIEADYHNIMAASDRGMDWYKWRDSVNKRLKFLWAVFELDKEN
jgi:hypothetical protein